MTQEEKMLIEQVIQQIQSAQLSAQHLDPEADAFIKTQLQNSEHKEYLLVGTVVSLQLANKNLQAQMENLQTKVINLQTELQKVNTPKMPLQETSFLGGIKQMFGLGTPLNAATCPTAGAHTNFTTANNPSPQTTSAMFNSNNMQNSNSMQTGNMTSPGPNYNPAAFNQSNNAPSFLGSIARTGLGVAGGVLIADAVTNLFSGHHNNNFNASPFTDTNSPTNETIINNYYPEDSQNNMQTNAESPMSTNPFLGQTDFQEQNANPNFLDQDFLNNDVTNSSNLAWDNTNANFDDNTFDDNDSFDDSSSDWS